MTDQKIENLLNLSLSVEQREREKSDMLETGFDVESQTWELIFRYNGDISELETFAQVTRLYGNYGIARLKETDIARMSSLPQVEYIENPKQLYYSTLAGKRASCIIPLQQQSSSAGQSGLGQGEALFGEGVIMAICDSGIDYASPAFRHSDGTTRILQLWDQTIEGNPPTGYGIGSVYDSAVINEALQQETMEERYRIVPSRDSRYHGTAVAGICCGSGINEQTTGIATKSDIIVVKLGSNSKGFAPNTTSLMQAVDFCVKKAIEYGRPMVINISIGNNYGSHDGTSIVETFLSRIVQSTRIVICVGAGNEGAGRGHAGGVMRQGERVIEEIAISTREQSISIQIWKNYTDNISVLLRSPDGQQIAIPQQIGTWQFQVNETDVLIYYGEPSPYSPYQEILIEMVPREEYVEAGIWQFELNAVRVVEGRYDMWLPVQEVIGSQTGFLTPEVRTTLTTPSTAAGVITVGAYQWNNESYADFSGRGYTRQTNQIKPDLVAPGVNVVTLGPNNSMQTVSGTSFATPFVSGACALMMEWGIVRGNDPYLYGEKVRAYLHKGARELPGFTQFPNQQVGFGALCLKDSLPL